MTESGSELTEGFPNPQAEDPNNPDAQEKPVARHLSEWLRDKAKLKTFLKYATPPVAVATIGFLAYLGSAELSGGSSPDQIVAPPPTIEAFTPTPSPNQTVEVTPIPTTVTQTEAPTPTPTSRETPAAQLGVWDIETEYSAPSHFRTIEQDQAILNTVMEKFPHIGNVKIILTSGESSATFVDPDLEKPVVIYAGRDAYDFERKLYNEFARVFDVRQPESYQRMATFYSPEQLNQMKILSDQIVEKWRNYPNIDKLFSPDKYGQTTLNRFTAYPDAVFLQESIDLKVPGQEWRYPLNQPIFESNINRTEIEELANEIPQNQESPYGNIEEFINAERSRLDRLQDPTNRLALTLIEENLDYLKNWSWTSTQNLTLDTRYLRRYYRDILTKYEEIALLCALGNNDPRLSQAFSEQDLQQKREQYQILIEEADKELFDTIYESVLMGKQEELISQYHAIVSSPLHQQ